MCPILLLICHIQKPKAGFWIITGLCWMDLVLKCWLLLMLTSFGYSQNLSNVAQSLTPNKRNALFEYIRHQSLININCRSLLCVFNKYNVNGTHVFNLRTSLRTPPKWKTRHPSVTGVWFVWANCGWLQETSIQSRRLKAAIWLVNWVLVLTAIYSRRCF